MHVTQSRLGCAMAQPHALPQPRGICQMVLWPRQRATGQSVHIGFAPGECHQCKTWVIYFHFGVAAGLSGVGHPQKSVPMARRAHCCCLLSSMAGGDTTQGWLSLVAQTCRVYSRPPKSSPQAVFSPQIQNISFNSFLSRLINPSWAMPWIEAYFGKCKTKQKMNKK